MSIIFYESCNATTEFLLRANTGKLIQSALNPSDDAIRILAEKVDGDMPFFVKHFFQMRVSGEKLPDNIVDNAGILSLEASGVTLWQKFRYGRHRSTNQNYANRKLCQGSEKNFDLGLAPMHWIFAF